MKIPRDAIYELVCLIVIFTISLASGLHAQEPIWDANTITLQRKQLAPGVFGVFPEQTFAEPLTAPKPTSGGFIVGEKAFWLWSLSLTAIWRRKQLLKSDRLANCP
jgi:hypothetical protein